MQGGTLVYGLEADTANPWAPYRASHATSGRAILKAISDPLFSEDPDGQPVGYLVESFEPNADYTEWTLTIRDGITFHDGTPLDGAAVEFNIESCQYSPLTGSGFVHDRRGHRRRARTSSSPPRARGSALPRPSSTTTRAPFMFSPTWLGSLEDVPQRDEAAAGLRRRRWPRRRPTATRPHRSGSARSRSSRTRPGNGNTFKTVRNEDYWRGPNGITDEELPYLDGIDFVVAVDEDTRSNSTACRASSIS